jgi:hypothetical protein
MIARDIKVLDTFQQKRCCLDRLLVLNLGRAGRGDKYPCRGQGSSCQLFLTVEGETKMPIARIPILKALVQMELDDFEDYLNTVDRFLKTEIKELGDRYDKDLQQLAQEGAYDGERPATPEDLLDMYYVDDIHRLRKVFPDILHKSLFLSLYNFLEAILNRYCDYVKRHGNLCKSFKDLGNEPDQSIRRARKYLVSIAKVSFPDSKEWNEITTYQKLRNCVVHNDGQLRSRADAKHLREYVSRNSEYLRLEFPSEKLVFQEGFCGKALYTVRKFLSDLYDRVKEKLDEEGTEEDESGLKL